MIKETIKLPGVNSPAPVAPATKAGGFIFVSGQPGWDGRNNCYYGEDIESQTRGAFENLKEVLEVAGSDLDHLMKVNIYLKDVNDFKLVNNIYTEYITSDVPARTCVQIAEIPMNALIEIEAIAIER